MAYRARKPSATAIKDAESVIRRSRKLLDDPYLSDSVRSATLEIIAGLERKVEAAKQQLAEWKAQNNK